MVGYWLLSTLSSIYDWFTPAVFFVLVNLVIGTIAIVSKSSSRRYLASVPELEGGGAAFPGRYLVRSLSRSPSVVLDRLRSFSLNRHYVELSPPTEAAAAAIVPAANQSPHFRPSEGEEDGGGDRPCREPVAAFSPLGGGGGRRRRAAPESGSEPVGRATDGRGDAAEAGGENKEVGQREVGVRTLRAGGD